MFFAKRIRKLEYFRYSDLYGPIHPQAFATIAISRPFLHLLANLTHITWDQSSNMPSTVPMMSVLFMSPTLKSIVVQSLWGEEEFQNHEFLHHIAARSPHIQHLGLSSDALTSERLDVALTDTIHTLKDLRSVSLSDTFLTTGVLGALSACPHLEVISQEDCLSFSLEVVFPDLQDEAFPNLKELHIQASLARMIVSLDPPFPATRLQRLSIRALSEEDHYFITMFLETVAGSGRNIQSLDLTVHHINREDISKPLTFSILEPLLACKSLTSLSIDTPLFLDLDNAHITLIASNWPQLRKLHLTPQPWPHVSHHVRTTFDVLPVLSHLLPKLEHLCLYIRPTVPAEMCSPFPNLQSLVLGSNTMEYNADEVARFLTKAAPPTCALAVAQMWTVPDDLVLESSLGRWVRHLELAISRVPMMRKADQEWVHALNGEIQGLTAPLN